ncbi:peptidase S51 dipeptidase E [Streptomyces corchorusii]|uniref:Peptidase S51 dipeptidase E n=2 Tax=Streptomyces TaxID=1883 RepID=A0A101QJJ2_STRCK|nr:peptidase E [Streptomyces corchorusii]KUN31113.1 peptidase S51 dipeptidase E [Streptomyces corchorusii]
MALVPGRRVALLGGGFSTDEDGLLDDWLLTRAGNPRPRVCFLPTASGDAPGYADRFLGAFRSRACVPSVLPLFRRELDDDALRTFLLAQDVVYVGGGNTANMPAVWRVHGVDWLLREACDRGTLLCGISAGANCWADASHTDSFGPLASLRDGLGLLPGSVCPHYDGEPGRRPSYRQAVAEGTLPGGWALEDGVGALFTDGRLTEAVTRRPGARLYRVEPGGPGTRGKLGTPGEPTQPGVPGAPGEPGGVDEHPVPCRPLGTAP